MAIYIKSFKLFMTEIMNFGVRMIQVKFGLLLWFGYGFSPLKLMPEFNPHCEILRESGN